MTKSTITRDESIQAVFDLNVGYTLGLADIEILKRVARMALAAMDSESGYLPLDYLQGHKDGLEWAAQLAEANHPETGDWLYDDPIELAKAIRKGPDMPPAQPAADSEPVAFIARYESGAIHGTCDRDDPVKMEWLKRGMDVSPLYAAPQLPQPAVVSEKIIDNFEEEFRRAFEVSAAVEQLIEIGYQGDKFSLSIRDAATLWKLGRAAMLAAAPQSPGSEPATVPGKWIPVSERMPENDVSVLTFDGMYKRVHHAMYGHWQCWEPEKITHWMPLPAAPREVK